MWSVALDAGRGGSESPSRAAATSDATGRLPRIFEQNYDFVWRTLRRLGLDAGAADDASQRVFLVAARRLPEIAVGGERPYLFGIALRVASEAHRKSARRREEPLEESPETADTAPRADEALDQRRARALLDDALARLPMDLRVVFTLHELEELSMSEIAKVVGIPAGTVASRLRRARDEFEAIVNRLSGKPLAKRIEGRR